MKILTEHRLGVMGVEAETLDQQLDDLHDALAKLSGITEVDFTAALQRGTVTVLLTVEAESATDARAKSVTALRTAIHDIGGATHGWDGILDTLESTVETEPTICAQSG